MDREQAAEEFARMLHKVGAIGAYEMFFEGMADPAVGDEKEKWQKITDWYFSKGSEEWQTVNMVLKEVLTL